MLIIGSEPTTTMMRQRARYVIKFDDILKEGLYEIGASLAL